MSSFGIALIVLQSPRAHPRVQIIVHCNWDCLHIADKTHKQGSSPGDYNTFQADCFSQGETGLSSLRGLVNIQSEIIISWETVGARAGLTVGDFPHILLSRNTGRALAGVDEARNKRGNHDAGCSAS